MISPGELVEAHDSLDRQCSACHDPFRGISTTKCISCHPLSDIGRNAKSGSDTSAEAILLFHDKLMEKECTACHRDHQGRHPDSSLSAFHHELLAPLDRGKCSSCHHRPADDLHKVLKAECSSCHHTGSWKEGARFRHELLTATDLNNCASCHAKPQDDLHRFTQESCLSCHDTSRWKPSTFDHDQYFVLDKDHNVKCETCHKAGNFKDYTCYGCHEHSLAGIRSEHREEGIRNIDNCVRCHKSADEHDIRMDPGASGKNERTINDQEKQNMNRFIE
ncbi:MAG: cytochrome c3 family protein, partial [Bacteroidia bacterium]|nr:cytochrome c3 family protein [Bacteroidia bacterium]